MPQIDCDPTQFAEKTKTEQKDKSSTGSKVFKEMKQISLTWLKITMKRQKNRSKSARNENTDIIFLQSQRRKDYDL